MKRIFLPLLLASLPLIVHAEIKLGKTFTPHMVLQRGMAVPVFGTASPGEEVKVQFRDQTKAVKADGAGKWRVQ
jgi:sialate O-acetylesterase